MMPVTEWNCGCKVRYDTRSFRYERRCDLHREAQMSQTIDQATYDVLWQRMIEFVRDVLQSSSTASLLADDGCDRALQALGLTVERTAQSEGEADAV